MKNNILTAFFALIFGLSSANGQAIDHQQGYWVRVFLRAELSEKWSVQLEADERRAVRPNEQVQVIGHARLHRTVGVRGDAALGFAYSKVPGRVEWRPYQEVSFLKKIGPKWQFSTRFRLDERWFGQPDGRFDFRLRGRGRLQFDFSATQKWRLKVSEEWMAHTDGFDQNRVYVAAERRFSKQAGIEVGWLKIFQKKREDSFFDRDILRTTFFFNIQKREDHG